MHYSMYWLFNTYFAATCFGIIAFFTELTKTPWNFQQQISIKYAIYRRVHLLVIIIIIIIRYACLLSQAFSSWYFSWTSGDPHRSGFKLHIAVLSVLCVMFQVQLSFVVNLSNVFLVQLPNFSLSFSLLFQGAPIITGTIVHFSFHIRCISIHKLLYLLLLLLLKRLKLVNSPKHETDVNGHHI